MLFRVLVRLNVDTKMKIFSGISNQKGKRISVKPLGGKCAAVDNKYASVDI